MNNALQVHKWDESYNNRQNFLFYPNEEVLRFLARYVVKRVDINQVEFKNGYTSGVNVLDFGCGIGRHMKLLDEMGMRAYGVDVSESAISFARKYLTEEGLFELQEKLLVGGGERLNFESEFFDVVVSHGVLDSMKYELAKENVVEIHRIIKSGRHFYFDVISGDDSEFEKHFTGEVTVQRDHEKGTVQSYFDEAKIIDLLGDLFTVVELTHVKRESTDVSHFCGRYHAVAVKT